MAITQKGFHKLAAAHGLDPEKHNDEDVDKEIKNSEEDMEELTNRAEKAETDLADERIKGDLAKYANRIGTDEKSKTHWKNLLISNRDAAVAALEALPEPKPSNPKAGKEPVHNRAAAGTPEALDAPELSEADQIRLGTEIRNRAAELQKGGMPHTTAFVEADRQVRREMQVTQGK